MIPLPLLAIPLGIFVFAAWNFLSDGPCSIDSSTHKSMTVDHSIEWNYGTFEKFMQEFNMREWKRSDNYDESFFGEFDYKKSRFPSQIHASIICFDDKGMVLRGKDWKKFKQFLADNKLGGRLNKGLWG